MSIDRFTSRALTQAVRTLGDGRENFLVNVVFGRGQNHPTNLIDFGVMNIPARVALFRKPNEPALPVNKHTGDSKAVSAPKIRLKKVFDENHAAVLNPALDSYAGPYMDPNAQIAEKVAMEQAELRRRIDRTVEVMCAQALFTGSITLTFEDGSTATITMEYTGDGATAGDTLTIQKALAGTDAWGSATSKPWRTIETLVKQIRNHSDYSGPCDLMAGTDSFLALVENEKVRQHLDTNNLAVGSLGMSAQAAYRGTYNGVRIFVYENGYVNSAGTRVEVWDGKSIAVVPQGGGGQLTIEHGAVYDRPEGAMQAQFIQTDYFSKWHTEDDPAVEELIVESRPLPLVKNPKVIRIQKVLV
jgi:hypothetical protein